MTNTRRTCTSLTPARAIRLATIAATLAAVSSTGLAQAVPPTTGAADTRAAGNARQAADQLAEADREFIEQAAQNGHAEIASSRLAIEKSNHAQVKAFAEQMVRDHTQANEKLKALGERHGVEVPGEASMLQKAKATVLGALEGETFDRRYAQDMGVEAHEETIELFREAVQEVRHPEVKQFAQETLPKLEHHLQMARELNRAVGNGDN